MRFKAVRCQLGLFYLLMIFLGACSSSKRTSEAHFSRDDYFLKIHNLKQGAPEFAWPVKYPQLSSFYGWRKETRMHWGLDMRAPSGTRIYAAASGKVIYAKNSLSGFGKMVILDHGGNWSSMYAHLTRYRTLKGAHVNKGDVIGLVGRTGRASGPHLHFEIRNGSDALDPMLFLPELHKK